MSEQFKSNPISLLSKMTNQIKNLNKQNEVNEIEEDLNNVDKKDFANTLRSSIASKQFDTYGNQSNIEYNDNENSQADFNYKDGKKLKIEL